MCNVAMGGSVLTLFTNRRDMECAYEGLGPRLGEVGLEGGVPGAWLFGPPHPGAVHGGEESFASRAQVVLGGV